MKVDIKNDFGTQIKRKDLCSDNCDWLFALAVAFCIDLQLTEIHNISGFSHW